MFVDELAPIFKELVQHPVSFLGGFVSGVLRLSLADDPVKSWLDRQSDSSSYNSSTSGDRNGKTSGPQSISID
ncbi:MAG: hypothetical protein CLLPBCKN_002951 [Chroococcidiopsis cubana SAG 39.79]|jgi:hypothetical protein|uniref:Uncharacterized protein n=2 Tax=Chroococcidiopsis TaxID=54298 RepID=K9TUU0_CHRTP|nr:MULTISPECIES: hypothetical protein [Chroococcidiopsis]MBE9020029.1 hypothetical protein [Chroococcidiopsidales cyanobacterium LEGE 13417]PSB43713.1 hypothetical protein C7B80_23255 [Cyanosarcina cf. burmensis CCALA 770]AFY86305.1 hypothetical protein Chro_0759 [Chroococcidiopsis thermalis PCC 7203]MDZ4873555.1 hypothetical protein [Chroococcidiopsis cubana SAG 39.79]PSB62330.1 hypothetical protein C7B79_18500 [Chroococcidiopsis cubana CCALA 043]